MGYKPQDEAFFRACDRIRRGKPMSDQPFFVGVNNPRFRGISSNGFLPALGVKDFPERTEPEEQEAPSEIGKLWEIVNQLRGMVKFLYLKETERRANASKRKHKDNI